VGDQPSLVAGVIGLSSAVLDNVPLVAATMGMFDMTQVGAAGAAGAAIGVVVMPLPAKPLITDADAVLLLPSPACHLLQYPMDSSLWQLVAFAAGTGGSLLSLAQQQEGDNLGSAGLWGRAGHLSGAAPLSWMSGSG
jgi:Na+/H+ antiporter NhaD/arsenite permease-like protein